MMDKLEYNVIHDQMKNDIEYNTISLGFYSISIPSLWSYEETNEYISIYSPYGKGAIQISAYLIPEEIKINPIEELADFVKSKGVLSKQEISKKIEENKDGAKLELVKEDKFWIFRILYNHPKILFVTYNCEEVNWIKEQQLVQFIISTIKFT